VNLFAYLVLIGLLLAPVRCAAQQKNATPPSSASAAVEARGSAREQTLEARGSEREQTLEARGSEREQEQADHAPRAYAVTLSGTYAFINHLPLRGDALTVRSAGVQLGGRFGWQVRGLRGGPPATVGFESDFLFQPGGQARDSYALIYGVFAKHSFTTWLRARPYFCYGLGAAQVWVSEVNGRGIGHATRVALGIDSIVAERLFLSFALSYQGIIMPSFAIDGEPRRDTSFHGLVLSTGLWFGS
jgi:hypothetical protein